MGGDELVHHLGAEAVAQVERHVRDAEGVAGGAGGAHRGGEQQARSVSGRLRVDPQPQGDADRLEARTHGLEQCDSAVHAAGHRHRDPVLGRRERGGVEGAGDRLVERVHGQRHALPVGRGRLQHVLQVGRPDAGGAEQRAALGELAGELGRGDGVRAAEGAPASGGDPAVGELELESRTASPQAGLPASPAASGQSTSPPRRPASARSTTASEYMPGA